MDLRHDWKVLNEVLYADGTSSANRFNGAVAITVDNRVLDGVVSSGKSFVS